MYNGNRIEVTSSRDLNIKIESEINGVGISLRDRNNMLFLWQEVVLQ